jgi:hypothetical protein
MVEILGLGNFRAAGISLDISRLSLALLPLLRRQQSNGLLGIATSHCCGVGGVVQLELWFVTVGRFVV